MASQNPIVLITGAEGRIGSAIAAALEEDRRASMSALRSTIGS